MNKLNRRLKNIANWPVKRKITGLALLLYWATWFILTQIPVPRAVQRAGVSDKPIHFLAYFIMTFLLWFTISPDRKVNWKGLRIYLFIASLMVYAAIEEFVQGLGVRTADIEDFYANMTGIAAALALMTFVSFWPALLTVTAAAIFIITNSARVNIAEIFPRLAMLFHFFSYALLTAVWLTVLKRKFNLAAPKIKWHIAAIAPLLFLSMVKLYSNQQSRPVSLLNLSLAAAAIAATIIAGEIIQIKTKSRNF